MEDTMTASAIFDKWSESITANADKAKEIGAIYQFNINGDGGGSWVLDLTEASVRSGSDDNAQCTVTMEAGDFEDMVEGRVQGQQLFMLGKLMIEGDMGLALRLQQVFEAVG
jgi:putative sterol carrier protein